MSLGFSKLVSSLLLMSAAAVVLFARDVQAQGKAQPHRSIELSETNSAEILTNLTQLTTKKDGFRELDEQLRSLKGLSLNSMDGSFSMPYVPPPSSPVSNKRIKELLDRQKNWSLSFEELTGRTAYSESDSLSKYDDDKSDGKKSSLQQFYDALNRSRTTSQNDDGRKDNRNTASAKDNNPRNDNGPDDDSNMPQSIRDKTQRLRQLVNEDSGSIFSPIRAHTSFDNFFGLNENKADHDPVTITKSPMESFVDQFKKALDGPSANINPALGSMTPATTPQSPTLPTSLDKLPTVARHDVPDASQSDPNFFLHKTDMQDLNQRVLNQWNPLYTPTKIETPKVTPPTPPNLEFPKRRF